MTTSSSNARFDFSRAERLATYWPALQTRQKFRWIMKGDSIRIVVPHAVASVWAESSEVAIEGSRHSCVQILIEKDFQCLHRTEEPDPDAYPHPHTAVKNRPAA